MRSIEIPTALWSSVQDQHRKIAKLKKMSGYYQLSGVHNPWGRAASIFDSWKLLDVCQSPTLLELVSEMMGDDIILWDSRFFSLADHVPKATWIRESDFSPFDTLQGVTVRIPVSAFDLMINMNSNTSDSNAAEILKLNPGSAIFHDVYAPYRYSDTGGNSHRCEYVIQYASGRSRFVRDQSSAVQRSLAASLPLINFGEAPIWLLQGVDHMNNDFAAGFTPTVAQWTDTKW